MFGHHGDAIWVEKGTVTGLLIEELWEMPGKEVSFRLDKLIIGAIFSKRVCVCLLISLSLCALSAVGLVLLDTHLPSWRRRCVKDKCSPLAVCIFGCLLNGYIYCINVKIRSNPSCSMWDLLFFTYGLFDLLSMIIPNAKSPYTHLKTQCLSFVFV